MEGAPPTPVGPIKVSIFTKVHVKGGSLQFLGEGVNVRSIDTTGIDISMYSKVDYHTPVQSVPSITFTLRALGRTGSALTIWSAQTAPTRGPVAGFTLPRQVFVLPTPISFRCLELSASPSISNVYVENVTLGTDRLVQETHVTAQEYIYPVDGRILWTANLPPRMNLAPAGMPSIVRSYTADELPLSLPLPREVVAATDPAAPLGIRGSSLSWFVCTQNFGASNDIPGVSYDPVSGCVVLGPGALYNGAAYIVAKSTLSGLACWQEISLNVAETPAIVSPGPNGLQASMTEYMDFTYQMQLGSGSAPPLTWSMYITANGADSTLPTALFLESAGLVTFQRYSNINKNVTVVAQNAAGGSSSVTFNMNVCQTPRIVPVPNDSLISIITNEYFTYQMLESDVRPLSLLTWSISPSSAVYKIDASTGMIQVLKNNYVNTHVTVTATNPVGGYDRYTFLLNVIQVPTINRVNFPTGLLHAADISQENVYEHALAQNEIGMSVYSLWCQSGIVDSGDYVQVGAFTISIGDANLEMNTNLDTYLQLAHVNAIPTGTLQLWSMSSSNVLAANSVSLSNFGTLTATKDLQGNVTVGIDKNINDTVTLITQNLTQLGVQVSWAIDKIVRNTPDSSIAVTISPLGALTASVTNGYIDVNLTVSVTNVYGQASATSSTTFRLLVAQPPVILQPPPTALVASLSPGQLFMYQFVNTPPGCGPITWNFHCTNSNVVFDPSTATIKLAYDTKTFVNEVVTISATAAVSKSSTTLALHMNVQQAPIFNMYDPIFSYGAGVPTLQHTMTKGIPYSVNLQQVVINPWGVDFSSVAWSDNIHSQSCRIEPASGVMWVANNVYINQLVQLTLTTSAGGSVAMTLLLHVMQAVDIESPGNIVARTTTSDFYLKLYQFTEHSGANTWYITDLDGAAIPGVSITSILDPVTNTSVPAIRCSANLYINSSAVIYNINELGDRQSVPVNILVAKDPHIPDSSVPPQKALMVGNNNFLYPFSDINFYTVNDSNAVGPITWSISAFPGLTISNVGLITFKNHHVITEYVTVTGTNLLGATVSSTFYMDISEQIQLADLGSAPLAYSMYYATDYSFSLAQSLGASSATWSLTPLTPLPPDLPPDVITINQKTGVITALHDNYINQLFELTVTQNKLVAAADGTQQIQLVTNAVVLHTIIAQTPVVAFKVPVIYVSLNGLDYVLTPGISESSVVNQVAKGTGPLTWNIAPVSRFMLINAVNGAITILKNSSYINNFFTLSAANKTNLATGISQPGIQIIIAQQPAIIVTPTIISNVDSSIDYIAPAIHYGIATAPTVPVSNSSLTGPLAWTISQGASFNVPPPDGVSIDAVGQIHLQAGKYVYNTPVTLTATTLAFGKDVKSTVLTLVRVPVLALDRSSPVSVDYAASTDFVMQVYQTRTGCGPLTWSISPSIPGLTCASSGDTATVTLSAATQIYSNVTVTTSNCIGGTGSVTFFLQKIHVPVIAPVPSPQLSSNITVPWRYTVREDLTQTNGISAGVGMSWSISPAAGLSIGTNLVVSDSNTAVITFQPGYYINGLVTVKATNVLGSNATTSFQLAIMDAPVLFGPTLTVTNTYKSNWTYQFSPANLDVAGNLTWSLLHNGNPDLTIDSASGLLTLAYSNVAGRFGYSQPPSYISTCNVTIRVSNNNTHTDVDSWITVYNAVDLTKMGADPLVSIYKPSINDYLTALYLFTNFNFTSAGIDGPIGPTLAQCVAAYVSPQVPWPINPAYFNMSTQGYQTWVVPESAMYSVVVAGAPGGCFSDSSSYGGCGAVLCGPMSFTESQQIGIIVGQRPRLRALAGASPSLIPGGGGGGGTFILDLTSQTQSAPVPVLVAGGGGGAGVNSSGAAAAQYDVKSTGEDGFTLAFGNNFVASDDGGFGGGREGGVGGAGGGGGGGWRSGVGGQGGSSYSQYNLKMSPVYGGTSDGVKNGQVWLFKLPPVPKSKISVTFTSCGQTGSTGPTWTQMQAAYAANSRLLQYLYPGNWAQRPGYQAWVVPCEGMYKITCAGASGGDIQQTAWTNLGGRGATITASYRLLAGDLLIITVGQQGAGAFYLTSGLYAGGGGGMTSVHRNGMYGAGGTIATAAPLLCAGGGPGAPGGTALATPGPDAPMAVAANTGTGPPSSSSGPAYGGGLYQGSGLTGAWQDIACMHGVAGGVLNAFGGFGGGAGAATNSQTPAGPGGGWTGGVPGSTIINTSSTGGTSYYSSEVDYVMDMQAGLGNYSSPGYVSIQQV